MPYFGCAVLRTISAARPRIVEATTTMREEQSEKDRSKTTAHKARLKLEEKG